MRDWWTWCCRSRMWPLNPAGRRVFQGNMKNTASWSYPHDSSAHSGGNCQLADGGQGRNQSFASIKMLTDEDCLEEDLKPCILKIKNLRLRISRHSVHSAVNCLWKLPFSMLHCDCYLDSTDFVKLCKSCYIHSIEVSVSAWIPTKCETTCWNQAM